MQHTKFSLTPPYSRNILFIYMETLLVNECWNQWSLVARNLCPDADVFKRAELPSCPSPLRSHTLSPACLVSGETLEKHYLAALAESIQNLTSYWELTAMYTQTIGSHKSVSLGCQAKNIAICINCSEEFQPWTIVGIVPPVAGSQI